jgi:arylsulfatase A-like enzyme
VAKKNNKMKLLFKIIIPVLLLISSCTIYEDFDKDKSFVFELNDSSQVAIGIQNWKGPEDCSATAYMNRTETGLLLTIRVRDDSVRTGNEFSYMNDGVEIYMDLRPPRIRNRNSYEKGVFQAVIIPLPGKKNVAPIEWYPKNYNSEVTGASAWTQLFDSSYIVQVFFPYSSLKRNHFWPRTYFSMDIAINDADSLNRETQMIWKGKSDNWSSPANFHPISLKDDKVEGRRTRKKKMDKPNILFIFTDQQTMAAMSAYGNPYVQTPNMDALAAAGVRFKQSYCSSPDCSSSRSSLITGMYPHQTGVNYNGQKPDSTIKNMGQLFREAGYRTIWGGKWQLPDIYPHTAGVDSVPGFEIISFASPEKTTGNGSDTDAPLADAMVKQIQRHPVEPWLIVVSFQNPHDIGNVALKPDAYLPAVNPESISPLPGNFEIDPFEPQFLKDCRKRNSYQNELLLSQKFSLSEWKNYSFQYQRIIEKVDLEIGKIIAMIEKQGYDENTLIIFTSDHGDGATAHHWVGMLSPYEEVMKVPLIVSWFGKDFKEAVDEQHLVSGIDILPTMLDYAGLPIPSSIEGKSLKPIIENPSLPLRDFLFAEIAPDPAFPTRLARMVRYRNYKYVVYSYGNPIEQLFDLKNDPGEMRNLANRSEHGEIKKFLRSNLENWMKEKKDYFKMVEK